MKIAFVVIICLSYGGQVCGQSREESDNLVKEGSKYLRTDPATSVIFYTQAIRADDSNGSAYFIRAATKEGLKDHHGAIVDFGKALDRCEDYACRSYVLMTRATVKGSMDDRLGAIEDLSGAIGIDPSCAQCYYLRGLAYGLLDRMDKSCSDMTKAGELGIKEAYESIRLFCQ